MKTQTIAAKGLTANPSLQDTAKVVVWTTTFHPVQSALRRRSGTAKMKWSCDLPDFAPFYLLENFHANAPLDCRPAFYR